MKTAYLDCFSGISGDMTLGALIHAGADKEMLAAELGKLDLKGYRIETDWGRRGSITGIHVQVRVDQKQPERSLKEILPLIEKSGLSTGVKEKSTAVFGLLAEAEAEVHGIAPTEVHFHEVGAVDSIIDVVGSVVGMEILGIGRLVASPVNVGTGTVEGQHGTLPIPAPATVSLLRGKPTYSRGPSLEMTTPTGAALLSGLARSFGEQPLMEVESVGYGLGSADLPGWPNCLRILIGGERLQGKDQCWVIESNIDDMNPEIFEYVADRLFSQGAVDVFFTPILMKKGRPATRISLLSPVGKEEALIRILFQETTAIGVRRYRVERDILKRTVVTVPTPYGEVPVKYAYLGDEVVNVSPEYEACRSLAEEKGVPLKDVYNEALRAALEKKP